MTRRRPVLEKNVQQQIRAALIKIGAKPYTIGRPPRRDAVFKGTGQTPGIPDLLVHMPASSYTRHGTQEAFGGTWQTTVEGKVPAHQLWIEVKAQGGVLSDEQKLFRDFCQIARVQHVVGGLDEVFAYLVRYGYVREDSVPHYRLPKAVSA